MKKFLVLVLMVVFLSLAWVSVGILSAQSPLSELVVGENTLGEVTTENPTPRFSFMGQANVALTIQVESLTSDFAPFFLVYDENDTLLHRVANPAGLAKLKFDFIPSRDTIYTLVIMGTDGEEGQFILSASLTSTEPAPPATELRNGMNIEDRVTPSDPIHRYQFTSIRENALFITIASMLPNTTPALVLTDLDGNPLGVIRSDLLGGSFIIPAAADVGYELLVIHTGVDQIEGYKLNVTTFSGGTIVTVPSAENPAQPTQTDANTPSVTPNPTVNADTQGQVIIPFDGPCALTTREPAGVNVREGPGLAYATSGGLFPNVIVPVTGRNEDTTWWQIEHRPGIYGWVADSVVRRGGNCSDIGVAAYPLVPPTNAQTTPTLTEGSSSEDPNAAPTPDTEIPSTEAGN